MLEAPSPTKWTPDELKRFYRAFHKYGHDFHKISKMVGGGKAPEMCASLYKRNEAYLSLNKEFQGEVPFVAMVQHASNHLPETTEPSKPNVLDDDLDTIVRRAQPSGTEGLSSDDEGNHRFGSLRNAMAQRHQQLKNDDMDDDDEDRRTGGAGGILHDEATAAATVVAMGSPGGTLLSNRSRRTPKRQTQSRTPSKRQRDAGTDADIYEYYDPTMAHLTESAKKRRATQKRLDFEAQGAATSSQRSKQRGGSAATRDDGDDSMKGFEALLALAEASNGKETAQYNKKPYDTELTDDEDHLGINEDDDKDEDYRADRRNRTPHSTPAKGKRPSSSHTTPRRTGVRAPGASPGSGMRSLGSPGWLAGLGGGNDGGNDLMGEFVSGAGSDFPYMLSSPGLPPQLQAGHIASPKNPMPRVRKRKNLPERSPLLISPLKSLYNRRSTLGSSTLLAMTGLVLPGATNLMDEHAGPAVAEIEQQFRHCLNPRIRKWAFYEFFYSAIDRPWFTNTSSIIADLAKHLGITTAPSSSSSPNQQQQPSMATLIPGIDMVGNDKPPLTLTRKQWSIIRSMLGRPRRLSWAYLRDSRARLEAYRTQARKFYTQQSQDHSLLTIMPRPIAVGQRVIARHPITRQLHDGCILTTAHHNYRVQYDRRELGVELVKDVDIMPYEPWSNLPLEYVWVHRRFVMAGRLVVDGRAVEIPLPSHIDDGSMLGRREDDKSGVDAAVGGGGGGGGGGDGGGGGGGDGGTVQRTPVILPDPALMAELAATLDKKESLLAQLRRMNDEASAGTHTDPVTGTIALTFREMYVQVVKQLREVNAALVAKIQSMEERSNKNITTTGNTTTTNDNNDNATTANDTTNTTTTTTTGVHLDNSSGHELLQRAHEISVLPPDVLDNGPITPQSLSDASLVETKKIIGKCRERVLADAIEQQKQQQNGDKNGGEVEETTNAEQQQQPTIDNNNNNDNKSSGDIPTTTIPTTTAIMTAAVAAPTLPSHQSDKILNMIQGAVWSLMTLQLGSDKIVPATVLAKALDISILGVKPSSSVNASLYIEIEAAMKGLKTLLTGSDC